MRKSYLNAVNRFNKKNKYVNSGKVNASVYM